MRKFFKRASGLFIANVKPKNALGKFKIRSILNSVRKLQSSVQNCCVCVHSQNKCSVVSIIILQKSQRVEPAISHSSRKLLRIKVTPDLHLTYSKNVGNLGLVLKMKNIACISILLTKHVKYNYLYLFKFVLYSIVAFKAN